MRKGPSVAHCCGSYTLHWFPFDSVWVGHRQTPQNFTTDDSFKREINRHILAAHHANKSIICCTLNSNQEQCARRLEEYGFTSSDWVERVNHIYTPGMARIKIFFYPVNKRNNQGVIVPNLVP